MSLCSVVRITLILRNFTPIADRTPYPRGMTIVIFWGRVTPSSSKKTKRRAMKSDRLTIGYDEDKEGAYIVVMRNEGEKVQMLVGLHDEKAKELYRYLTDQEYAMKIGVYPVR